MGLARARSKLATLAVVALAALGFLACTDGTTPDCSDAATPCGPNVGDAAAAADGQPLDASAETSLPEASVPEASADADLDAGDEI